MARATQTKTISTKTTVTIKPKTSSLKTPNNGTGRKRCPSCGKYM